MERATARHRHRATSACIQCRKARIRCVLDSGSKACVNCTESSNECVFDEKDGRKCRASIKSVEANLQQKIKELEQQLHEERTSRSADKSPSGDLFRPPSEHPPPYTSPEETSNPQSTSDGGPEDDQAPEEPEQASSVVTKLMPSSIRFDMASGRVRYFGSTTHMNVLSKMSSSKDPRRRHAHWPIALIARDLSPETHNYLMDLFWTLHNSVIHLVHLEAFNHDQAEGGVEFYSTFLHLTMLATGFRYADKGREDIRRLSLHGHASSTLHEKAKALAKLEIDRPGGIPSIQAFQLLGGLEFCCGNDDTGWIFTGMCFRMVFDAGLHVDPSSLGLPERETQIRHMVLWACLITDRLWSLYLGRPTTLKTSDIAQSCLSFDFARMILCQPSWHEKKVITRIYEALLQMVELVSQLCDLRGPRPPKSSETYFKLAAIDQQLRDWYARLPLNLQWSPEIHSSMPPSYYLLHTQYHAALILLHRPFVQYSDKGDSDVNSHFTTLSRTSCAESATRIAAIFEQYRSRFDLSQVYGTAVQHAGTAATALMGETILQTDAAERDELVEQLSSLRLTISHMSRNYQPAGLMTSVLDQFIRSVRKGGGAEQRLPDAAPPLRTRNGEASSARTAETWDASLTPELGGFATSRKRARVDGSCTFTPTCPGAQSPQGLPFLPSSFLEGLDAEDSMFADLVGSGDAAFQWDYPAGIQ